MKLSVEVYIKKNTKVYAGIVTTDNSTPFLTVTDSTASYTTDQYIGHYIKITSGENIGLLSYIASNTNTVLTLQTAIEVNNTDTYEIYRSDYQRLDLFKDEKISITSQISNSNDIGKLYTDYTQSFSIPASKNNNQILSHWYESSIDEGFDHRMRYDAYIEVNTQRFKNGTIQLEKADKKNGFIESYSITFYGNLTQLKDVIKDDKLNTLDYSVYNHTYDSANVRGRITNATTTGDIKYPLIGNAKKYYYQDATHASDDITTLAGAVRWNDLYPAIKLSNIFLKIQSKYGLTFTGSFFSLDQWRKLYLYLKPSLSMSEQTQRIPLNFTTITSSPFTEMNLTTDVLRTKWDWVAANAVGDIYNKIEITIVPAGGFGAIPYSVFIYKDGDLYNSYTGLTGTRTVRGETVRRSEDPNSHNYTFRFSSDFTMNFAPTVKLTRHYNYIVAGNFLTYLTVGIATNTSMTTIGNIDIVNYVPDIKINDFLTGIIKAFNLMIIPRGNNTFEFAPLELYYNAGKTLDLTEYVYSQDLSVEKPKLYKSINFTYEESPNILNNAFRGLYAHNYGDLIYKSERITESATYDIKLPFENVLFEVPTQGKLFQTATLVDKDLKPYIPKPMLIYCNGLVTPLTGSDRIYLTNSTGAATQITNYNRFSNEYDSLPSDTSHSHLMTMNFGNEQSSWLNELAPQGLYFRNYRNYVNNLYNIKTRILKVKALLPPSLLGSTVTNGNGIANGIALNDRLVIRNKRYIINSFTTDLTTGEANFELITDYRGIDAASSVGYRFANLPNIQTDKETIDIDLVVYLNDYDYFNVKGPAALSFLSYSAILNNTQDVEFTITVAYNATGVDRVDVVGLEYYRDGALTNEYIIVTQTAI